MKYYVNFLEDDVVQSLEVVDYVKYVAEIKTYNSGRGIIALGEERAFLIDLNAKLIKLLVEKRVITDGDDLENLLGMYDIVNITVGTS